MIMNANGQFRDDEVVVRKSKINGEWVENRYVKIGGKLRVLHQDNDQVSILTEIVRLDSDYAVTKATVQTAKGTFTGIGVASLKMDARIGDAIASLSETRAVARACRHAGYAMDSCGAEELAFGEAESEREQTVNKESVSIFPNGNGDGKPATMAQVRLLFALAKKANLGEDDKQQMLSPLGATTFNELTCQNASSLITQLRTKGAS